MVPGTFTKFPIHKVTKLIEKDFMKMKYEHEIKETMKQYDFIGDPEDGSKNSRLEEVRKAAIEVDRANLINQQLQKLKMNSIYGKEPPVAQLFDRLREDERDIFYNQI